MNLLQQKKLLNLWNICREEHKFKVLNSHANDAVLLEGYE